MYHSPKLRLVSVLSFALAHIGVLEFAMVPAHADQPDEVASVDRTVADVADLVRAHTGEPLRQVHQTLVSRQAREITESRSEHGRCYELPDGRQALTISAAPIHFIDADGHYRIIDNSIVPTTTDGYAFTNEANSFDVYLPDIAREPANVKLVCPTGAELLLHHDVTFWHTTPDGHRRLLQQAAASTADVAADTLTYHERLSGAGESYSVRFQGLRHGWEFSDTPAALKGIADGTFEIERTVTLPAGSSLFADGAVRDDDFLTGSDIVLTNAIGDRIGWLAAPWAHEGAATEFDPEVCATIPLSYRVTWLAEDTIRLATRIPADWITDTTRRYPISTRDSSYYDETQGGDDCYQWDTSTFNHSADYFKVGYSGNYPYYISFMTFYNLNIPAGSTIDLVELYWRAHAAYSNTCSFEWMFEDTDSAQRCSNEYPDERDYVNHSAYSSSYSTSWAAGSWYGVSDFSAGLQDVVDRAGWSSGNNVGLRWGAYSSSGEWRQVHSYDSGSGYAPYLYIEFTPGSTDHCYACPTYDYSISPTSSWQTHSDSFDENGCRWYRAYLSTSYEYTFTVCQGGGSYADDTVFDLYNSSCSEVDDDDDTCGAGSEIVYAPNSTGYYYLRVRGYSDDPDTYTLAYLRATADYSVSGTVKSRRWPYHGVPGVTVQADTGQSATTNNDGEYTITDVPAGSRTITASKSDWWATGSSNSASTGVTVNGNETGVNFSDFACKATAGVSISVDDSTVDPGQTFNVTVSVANTNYSVNNVAGYADLSFSGDDVTPGTATGSGWNFIDVFAPGHYPLYGVNSSGDPITMTATDYLVSGFRENSFSNGVTYSVTVPLTVSSSATGGSVVLMYRGTIGDERDPDSYGSGTRDQQGFNVLTYTVIINQPQPDLKGANFDVPNTLNAGDTFDATFMIDNDGSATSTGFNVAFYLSDNSTISTSDEYLGTQWVGAMGGLVCTLPITKQLTLPPRGDSVYSSGDGTYYVGMIVDINDDVDESNESNNRNTGDGLDREGVQVNGTIAPVPSITAITLNGSSASEITVEEGNAIDIAVTAQNTGGDSPYGTIQVSFAQLTSGGDRTLVTQGSPWGGDLYYHDYYPGGPEDIWYMCGTPYQATAQYLLVNAEDSSWTAGESNTATLHFSPTSAGTYYVYIKVAMEVSAGNYALTPTSGSQDQQCEYVLVRTINVTSDDFQASYGSGVSPNIVMLYQRRTLSLTITNSGSVVIPSLGLGLDIHNPSGQKVESTKTSTADPETGKIGRIDFQMTPYDLGVGQSRTFSADYTFATSVVGDEYAPGTYELRYVAWAGGMPGDGGAQKVGELQSESLTITTGSQPARDIPILMYHKVDETAPTVYWVTAENFASQMGLLCGLGYETIEFDDLRNYMHYGSALPARPVIVTFDDAYQNVYDHARPIMTPISFTGVISVPTDYIGNSEATRENSGWDAPEPVTNHMIWPEIQDLHNAGWSIESHSASHPDFSTLNYNERVGEINAARNSIFLNIGEWPDYFTYPFGYIDTELKQIVQDAGHLGAPAVISGIENTATANLFELRRVNIESDDTLADFAAKIGESGAREPDIRVEPIELEFTHDIAGKSAASEDKAALKLFTDELRHLLNAPPCGPEPCGTMLDYQAYRKAYGLPEKGHSCAEGACDNAANRDAAIPDGDTPIKTLRLRFHIFGNDDGSSYVSTQNQVNNAVNDLNTDYLEWRIQFEATTEFVDDTTYRDLEGSEIVGMKSAYNDSPETQLNLYVCNFVNDLAIWGGVATFPWDSRALGAQGGIYLDDNAFNSPANGTVVHEVGHCIGLWHPFHGVAEVSECSTCYEQADGTNADITGDLCSDTRPTPKHYSCSNPGGTDPCSETAWGETPFRNYMGYTNCRSQFTEQQSGRMHCWINDQLSGWVEVNDSFVIHNDGTDVLHVSSITKQSGSSWLSFTAPDAPHQPPFTIPGCGVKPVGVSVNPAGLSPGVYTDRLVIQSDDPDENPYPNGVNVTFTIPECVEDDDCSDGNPCTDDRCNDGFCDYYNESNGTSCPDDGNDCTDDECQSGTCTHPYESAGHPCGSQSGSACDDPDTCDGAGVCLSNPRPNGTPCPDGAFCNGEETCQNAVCQPGNDPCPGQPCNEAEDSCVACLIDEDCDDGQYCNGTETCDDDTCQPGTSPCTDPELPYCNEDNDTCDACAEAVHCDNGQFCDGTEVCAGGACQPGVDACKDPAFPFCDEDNDECDACLKDIDCDDGHWCNGAETCDGYGACQPGIDPCEPFYCNEDTDACVGGACCEPDGACTDLAEEPQCQTMGQTFHDGKACVEVSCVPTGACCTDSACTNGVAQEHCETVLGGVFAGPNAMCEEDVCVPGACCLLNGDCADDYLAVTCIDGGGTFQGPGSACATTTCPEPVGACCLFGACVPEQQENACASATGAWAGPATTCDDPAICTDGACCVGEVCTADQEEAECIAAGGAWAGLFSDCFTGMCPMCADGDANRDGTVDLSDFARFQLCWDAAGVGDCKCLDMDNDNDIDMEDYGAFNNHVTGP